MSWQDVIETEYRPEVWTTTTRTGLVYPSSVPRKDNPTITVQIPVKVRQMKWQDLHDEIEKLSAPKRDEGLQLWQEQKDANDKATCCRGKYLAKVRMWLVETWNNLDNNANVA